MKARNAALGGLAGGVALGLLLASKRGIALRKKFSKMPGKVKDSLEDTVGEIKDMFSVSDVRHDGAAKRVAQKAKSPVRKTKRKG